MKDLSTFIFVSTSLRYLKLFLIPTPIEYLFRTFTNEEVNRYLKIAKTSSVANKNQHKQNFLFLQTY